MAVLLRGGKTFCPHNYSISGFSRGYDSGNIKVDEFHMALQSEDDIFRFQVPAYNWGTGPVQGSQCQLSYDTAGIFCRDTLFRQDILQIPALHIFLYYD